MGEEDFLWNGKVEIDFYRKVVTEKIIIKDIPVY